jgi:hypothetical protein
MLFFLLLLFLLMSFLVFPVNSTGCQYCNGIVLPSGYAPGHCGETEKGRSCCFFPIEGAGVFCKEGRGETRTTMKEEDPEVLAEKEFQKKLVDLERERLLMIAKMNRDVIVLEREKLWTKIDKIRAAHSDDDRNNTVVNETTVENEYKETSMDQEN